MMPRMHILFFFLAVFSVHRVARAEEDDHDDHDDHGDHGEDHPWEWEGTMALHAHETYTWSAARGSGGAYADPEMKLVVVPAAGGRRLEGAEEGAEELWGKPEAEWVNASSGDVLQIGAGGAAFNLRFNEESWLSLFYLQPSASGSYVFFAQHFPSEFENEFHFLRDEHGRDVEPTVANEEAHTDEQRTHGVGVAIGAAALTASPGLLMIGLVGPLVARVNQMVFPLVNAFASGAIFSCAAFLLMPEGLHLAGAGQDEVTGSWTWGTGLMVGWVVGVVIHHLSSGFGRRPGSDVEDVEAVGEGDKLKKVDFSVAGPVLFGDFWHNFVDGLVIGFSSKACSSSALWAVVAATVAHEAVQEVADFIVLLTKAHMEWKRAVLCNAASALPSAVVGAVIAHQADVSVNLQGILLAFGAGVYLFVAVTELASSVVRLPAATSPADTVKSSLARLGAFALGATLIGLVLLGHEHCGAESAEAGGDHHGHGHRI